MVLFKSRTELPTREEALLGRDTPVVVPDVDRHFAAAMARD